MDMLGANVGDVKLLHHTLACTWRPSCMEGFSSSACTRLYTHVSWQCYAGASAPCPAGQYNDKFMHKSNELHEAERAIVSGD